MADSDWRSVIQTVAPTVATFFGGPLAGLAATMVGRVLLGKSETAETTMEEAQKAIATAALTPEGLVKLKEVEARVIELQANLQLELTKQAVENTKSARDMQVATRDPIPGSLAKITIFLFFLVVAALMYGGYLILTNRIAIPEGNRELQLAVSAVLGGMIQQLASMVKDIYGFYYGGSIGSSEKNEAISSTLRNLTTQPTARPQ